MNDGLTDYIIVIKKNFHTGELPSYTVFVTNLRDSVSLCLWLIHFWSMRVAHDNLDTEVFTEPALHVQATVIAELAEKVEV